MEPRAPDYVRYIEDPLVFQHGEPVSYACDPGDSFDPLGNEVLWLDADEGPAGGEDFGRTFRPIGVLTVSTRWKMNRSTRDVRRSRASAP